MASSTRRRSPIPKKTGPDEWVLARLPAPLYVEGNDDGPQRPDAVLCFDPRSDKILGIQIVPPEAGVDAALGVLHQAMTAPSWGKPRRPGSLRTNERAIAEAVRSRYGIAAREAPTPEARELLASFAQHLSKTDGAGGARRYLESGASPEEVARFFAAAARLWRAKPWEKLPEHNLLRLSIPSVGVPESWVSVLGAAGEAFGLGFFHSLDSFFAMRAAGPAPEAVTTDLRAPTSTLLFEAVDELPAWFTEDQRARGWPLASPRAFPSLVTVDADLVRRPMRRDDIVHAALVTEAVVEFWNRHAPEWSASRDPVDEIVLEQWPGKPTVELAAQNVDPWLEDSPPASADPKELFPHVIDGLFDFVRRDRRLATEIEAAHDFFFGQHRARGSEGDEHAKRLSWGQFMEWFCLDRPSRGYGEAPIRTYLRTDLRSDWRAVAELFTDSKFSFFEVVDVVPEKSLTVRDLQSDEELVIREKLATRTVSRAGLVIGRLFPLGDGTWTMSGVSEYRTGADIEAGTEFLRRARAEGRGGFAQLDAGREKGRASGFAHVAPWTGSELQRRLRFALREGRIQTSIPSLKKQIRAASEPAGILEQLMAESARKDEEWQFEISQLVTGLWNVTPRLELGNRAPADVRGADVAGPEEERLIRELVEHLESLGILETIDGAPEQARDRITVETARWMSSPQDRLGGLSPRQVIDRERRTVAARRLTEPEDPM